MVGPGEKGKNESVMRVSQFVRRVCRGSIKSPYGGWSAMLDMRTAVIPFFLVILPFVIVFFIVDNLLGLSPAHKRVWWPILPSAGIWLLSLLGAYWGGGDPRPIDMRAVMFRYGIFGAILIVVGMVVVTGCGNRGCS